MFKTFRMDHIVRDVAGKPLGRAVLAQDYEEGCDIGVAVMDVPRASVEFARRQVFYIDGVGYKISESTPEIKFTFVTNRLKINNFILKKV